MKSMLVIDTPNECVECPLRSVNKKGIWCQVVCEPVHESFFSRTRMAWCPLKPVPEKYKGDLRNYEVGWNDCIDEITGETE